MLKTIYMVAWSDSGLTQDKTRNSRRFVVFRFGYLEVNNGKFYLHSTAA